jgi:hypothetical protein
MELCNAVGDGGQACTPYIEPNSRWEDCRPTPPKPIIPESFTI